MKNILKTSLLMTIITIAFILLGSTNVNAAADVFLQYDHNNPDYGSYDFGDIGYGNYSKNITVEINNPTNSDVIITNYSVTEDYYNITKSDGSSFTVPFTIPAHDLYSFQIQLKQATETNFPRNLINTVFSLSSNNEDELKTIVQMILNGTDVKNTVETPVINPNDLLTYNGREQTMDFYTYNGTDYTLVNFNDADLMYNTTTRNIATTAGTYTAQFTLKNPTLYKWDDSLSANLSGANNETYSIEWKIKQKREVVPTTTYQGTAGNELSTISNLLPTGWVWETGTTIIDPGTKTYNATFTHPTDTINYETFTTGLSVKGLQSFYVGFDLSQYGNSGTPTNPVYLTEGDSKSYTITTDTGYLFTSIKINGVEQLGSSAVDSMPIQINNISKNYEIIATTERIAHSPMPGYENLTYDIFKDKLLQIKWDLDFDTFYANWIKLNGKEIFKGFKFTRGSVILELDTTVLASLPLGENKIEIDLASGELAVATFNVIDTTPAPAPTPVPTPTETNTNNPGTGDSIVTYSIIGLVAIIAITGIIVIRKFN